MIDRCETCGMVGAHSGACPVPEEKAYEADSKDQKDRCGLCTMDGHHVEVGMAVWVGRCGRLDPAKVTSIVDESNIVHASAWVEFEDGGKVRRRVNDLVTRGAPVLDLLLGEELEEGTCSQ